MRDFDAVWRSILALQGETFRLKRGQPFSYVVSGSNVVPSTTNRQLSRSQFARAFKRMPVKGPAQLADLRGPSYLFAILADPRITGGGSRTVPAAPGPDSGNAGGHRAAPAEPAAAPSLSSDPAPGRPSVPVPDVLARIDARRALLVVAASAEKALGGESVRDPADWCSQALRQGRERVLAAIPSDPSRLLPAWQRYMGSFYQHAGAALAEAVADGNVVIISGGYGIVPAGEPIGWYDGALHRSDWPAGLLEGALIGEARRAGAEAVVAFAPAASAYAEVVRSVPWRALGLTAYLVTATGARSDEMTDIPRQLGLAFKAFWHQDNGGYPEDIAAGRLD